MARKNNASKKKQIEQELMESMQSNADFDPIKRQLKINQFEWTEKQKERTQSPSNRNNVGIS